MPAARRNANIAIGGVRRYRLQDVEDVEAKLQVGPWRLVLLKRNVAFFPQMAPSKPMRGENLIEPSCFDDRSLRFERRFRNRVIERAVDGDDLLDSNGSSGAAVQSISCLITSRSTSLRRSAIDLGIITVETGAGGLGDADQGLVCARAEKDHIGANIVQLQWFQMPIRGPDNPAHCRW